MKLIINIKAVDTENTQLEELFVVKAQLMTVDSGFQDLRLDTPDWVTDKLTEVSNEITSRVRGELIRRLKAAQARDSALKPKSEVRKDLQAEIKNLEKMLE